MADVICGQALLSFLTLEQMLLNNSFLCLYEVAHVPTTADTAGDYTTIECTFPGYARIPINPWSAPVLLGGVTANTNYPPQSFTLTAAGGPFPVYGYFLLDALLNLIGAGQNPAAPVQLANAGDQYVVTPNFNQFNG